MTATTLSNSCVECDEAITNPICPECLAERMRTMVGEKDTQLAKQIQGFAVEGETHCLFCGKNMGICAYCFSKDVYEYLLEQEPGLAYEFMGRFNFGLREMFA